jgi:hypothetical protein
MGTGMGAPGLRGKAFYPLREIVDYNSVAGLTTDIKPAAKLAK